MSKPSTLKINFNLNQISLNDTDYKQSIGSDRYKPNIAKLLLRRGLKINTGKKHVC